MVDCNHKVNKTCIEVAKKAINPDKVRVQCVKCGTSLRLKDVKDVAGGDKCQNTKDTATDPVSS